MCQSALVRLVAAVAVCGVLTADSAAVVVPASRVLDLSKGGYAGDDLTRGQLLKHGDVDQWEALDLSDNDIVTIDDDAFAGFANLVSISLSSNSLGTVEGERFRGAPRVARLDLSNNTLVAIRSDAFAGLAELGELDLADNLLRPFATGTFRDNAKLTRLSLGNNPRAHRMFENVTIASLEELDMRGCRLATLATVNFENMPNLKKVDLEDNVIRRLDEGSLRTNAKLEELNLRGNHLYELRGEQLKKTFATGARVTLHYDHDPDMCVECGALSACAEARDDAELQRYLCENPQTTNASSVYRGVYEWKNPAENTVVTLMAH